MRSRRAGVDRATRRPVGYPRRAVGGYPRGRNGALSSGAKPTCETIQEPAAPLICQLGPFKIWPVGMRFARTALVVTGASLTRLVAVLVTAPHRPSSRRWHKYLLRSRFAGHDPPTLNGLLDSAPDPCSAYACAFWRPTRPNRGR